MKAGHPHVQLLLLRSRSNIAHMTRFPIRNLFLLALVATPDRCAPSHPNTLRDSTMRVLAELITNQQLIIIFQLSFYYFLAFYFFVTPCLTYENNSYLTIFSDFKYCVEAGLRFTESVTSRIHSEQVYKIFPQNWNTVSTSVARESIVKRKQQQINSWIVFINMYIQFSHSYIICICILITL